MLVQRVMRLSKVVPKGLTALLVEGQPLNICEICGTGNNEQATECRVCGNPLLSDAIQQPAHVVADSVAAQDSADSLTAQETGSHSDDPPWNLQVSSVTERAPTGAPPMLNNRARQEPIEPDSSPRSQLPGFMQAGSRANGGNQESVELISANDLPSWIRQIAEADAAKEQAEAEAAQSAAAESDAPASLVKRALPGETRTSAPPTSWLSKSSAAQEPSENWASEETAAANWGSTETSASQPTQPTYPTISSGSTYAPSTYEQADSSSKRRVFGRTTSPSNSDSPIYRRRPVQLALLILLVVLLAAMLV